ncbi:hypothetical protein ACVBEG_15935 [Pseudomonas sp. GG8]
MTAIHVCVSDGPTHHRKPEESGIKIDQTNANHPTAFLCCTTCVGAQKTKSLCCVAVGITTPISSTAEALVPHEKLREAATPNAALIAQNRPPAQPVVGYMHVSGCVDALPESTAGRRYWLLPETVTTIFSEAEPRDGSDSIMIGVAELELILQQSLEATHNRIVAMEQDKASVWNDAQALVIESYQDLPEAREAA